MISKFFNKVILIINPFKDDGYKYEGIIDGLWDKKILMNFSRANIVC